MSKTYNELEKFDYHKTSVINVETNTEQIFTVPAKEAVVLAYLLSIEFDSSKVTDYMEEAIVLEGQRTYLCERFVAYKESYLEECRKIVEQQAILQAVKGSRR